MNKFLACLMMIAVATSESILLASKNDFLRYAQLHSLGGINWPFAKCSDTSAVNVVSLQMGNAPKLGSGADITVIGKNTENFNLDKVKIAVFYKGFHLVDRSTTDGLPKAEVSGQPFVFRYKVDIPSYAFHGNYKVELHWMDNGADKGCTAVEFTL